MNFHNNDNEKSDTLSENAEIQGVFYLFYHNCWCMVRLGWSYAAPCLFMMHEYDPKLV